MHKEFNKTLQNYLLFLKTEKKFKKKIFLNMKIQLKKLIIGQIQIFKKILNGTIMLKRIAKPKLRKPT